MAFFIDTFKNKNKNNKMNNKKVVNKTRKNLVRLNIHGTKLEHLVQYSDGFIRRMTEPISVTIFKPSDAEQHILNSKIGPILSDDEKWELYINGK